MLFFYKHSFFIILQGLGSNGSGHLSVTLTPGIKYYVTVRAITGSGNILDSSSDGFTVDKTAPVARFAKLGLVSYPEENTVIYQQSKDGIELVVDSENNANLMLAGGSYPGL